MTDRKKVRNLIKVRLPQDWGFHRVRFRKNLEK